MRRSTFRLVFGGPDGSVLIATEFHAADGTIHFWKHSKPAPGLVALAAFFVGCQCGDGPFSHPEGVARISKVWKEAGRSRSDLKWLLRTFGSLAYIRRLVVFDGENNLRTISLNREEITAEDITVVVDGAIVAEADHRKLQRLYAALLDRVEQYDAPPAAVRPESQLELVERVRRGVGPAAADVAFVIGEVDVEVARRAARHIIETVEGYFENGGTGPFTIGLSGGLLQMQIIREIHASDEFRTMKVPLRVVALSRMRWDDWRAERSASHLAFRLIEWSSSSPDIVLPPLSPLPARQAAYRAAVRSCHLLVLSSGSVNGSFISEYLRLHGEAMPASAVGDLCGNLISAMGQDAATRRSHQILAPLGCQPSLADLRDVVASGPGQVMLIADDIARVDRVPSTKARVVRAALIAGLVNTVVTSRNILTQIANARATPQGRPPGTRPASGPPDADPPSGIDAGRAHPARRAKPTPRPNAVAPRNVKRKR